MKLTVEPRPVLAICLNPAWQKTLIFKHVEYGEVNRAAQLKECGGGKGVNVVRVFRRLGLPVTLAAFAGGETGRKLEEELRKSGADAMISHTEAVTRCCSTLISQDNNEATEIIEPSGMVTEDEQAQLLNLLTSSVDEFGAVVFSGTVPPGVSADFSACIARAACDKGVPFILDAYKNIEPVLEAGCALLKINAGELKSLSGKDDIIIGATEILERYPELKCLAVTAGASAAYIFYGKNGWKIDVPKMDNIVSAIGCGDCATAIMARRIAEGVSGTELANSFAEALACASASCMTDTPSVFDTELAEHILQHMVIEQIQ